MRLHRDAHQVFQQPGNMRARRAVIAVAPLRETHHQSVAEQPGKMALVVEADTSATVLSSVAVHARPSISAQRILTLDESERAEATIAIAVSSASSGSLSCCGFRRFIQKVWPIFGHFRCPGVIIGKENEPVTVVAVLYQNINTIMGRGVCDVSPVPRDVPEVTFVSEDGIHC